MVSSKIARKLLCATAAIFLGVSVISTVAEAQEMTEREKSYSATLQKIADQKLAIAQKQAYIANQENTISSMRSQLETLPETKESIRPIVMEMTAEIEKIILSDIPFRQVERLNRLDDLKESLADPAIGESVLFRKAMTLYDVEANYGNTVGSYSGESPKNAGVRYRACEKNKNSAKCSLTDDHKEKLEAGATLVDLKDTLPDGNFIHFGRLSLVYLELDSSEGYRYNKDTNDWDRLEGGEIIGIRRAVRIARGESAPGVVRGPVPVSESAE